MVYVTLTRQSHLLVVQLLDHVTLLIGCHVFRLLGVYEKLCRRNHSQVKPARRFLKVWHSTLMHVRACQCAQILRSEARSEGPIDPKEPAVYRTAEGTTNQVGSVAPDGGDHGAIMQTTYHFAHWI